MLTIKLYADGANLDDMLAAYQGGIVRGFTTNPTLMRKVGITNYEAFAREVLQLIPDRSISFEVFADDFETMAAVALPFFPAAGRRVRFPTTRGMLAVRLGWCA